jgi:2',3'-cyclic-nucleotide 2'-phosphodiesterase (5'-nucleotidase family)
MTKFNRLAICALFFASVSTAHGKLVQILHTNDTHSFISEGTHGNGGGSARLKSLIEFYKDKAENEGVENLVFDAGDFLEGNTYYMAEKGRASFNVHNQMGYDMVTLGNHDYLMGARELDKMLGEIDLRFTFLAANLEISSDFPNIRKKIKHYKEIEIAGVKLQF